MIMNYLTLTKEEYLSLKKTYNSLDYNPKTIIRFKGHDILMSYLKYMLEYLGTKFK